MPSSLPNALPTRPPAPVEQDAFAMDAFVEAARPWIEMTLIDRTHTALSPFRDSRPDLDTARLPDGRAFRPCLIMAHRLEGAKPHREAACRRCCIRGRNGHDTGVEMGGRDSFRGARRYVHRRRLAVHGG